MHCVPCCVVSHRHDPQFHHILLVLNRKNPLRAKDVMYKHYFREISVIYDEEMKAVQIAALGSWTAAASGVHGVLTETRTE